MTATTLERKPRSHHEVAQTPDVAAGEAENSAARLRHAPASGNPVPAFLVRTESPIGRIELTADDEAITSLSMECAETLPHDGLDERTNPVLDEALRQLAEYFAGDRKEFDLPLKMQGTPFQQAVWTQLKRVGWGEFVSYGELGLAAGRPGSGRAVGGAVGANPIPIIVGCHRVLASNQKITGYSGGNGIPTKVWLLDHESIGHL